MVSAMQSNGNREVSGPRESGVTSPHAVPRLVVLAVRFASAAHADAIGRFKSFVANTQSARADFEQQVYDRDGKVTQASKGSFVFRARAGSAGPTPSRSTR